MKTRGLLLIGSLLSLGAGSLTQVQEQTISYVQDIEPIFKLRCAGCHSDQPWAENRRDLFDVTSYSALREKAFSKYIVPRSPESSRLLQVLANLQNGHGRVGPLPSLPPSEFQKMVMWIRQGAGGDDSKTSGESFTVEGLEVSSKDALLYLSCLPSTAGYVTLTISDPETHRPIATRAGAINKIFTPGSAAKPGSWMRWNRDGMNLPAKVDVTLTVQYAEDSLGGTFFVAGEEKPTDEGQTFALVNGGSPAGPSYSVKPQTAHPFREKAVSVNYYLARDADVTISVSRGSKPSIVYVKPHREDGNEGQNKYTWTFNDRNDPALVKSNYVIRFEPKSKDPTHRLNTFTAISDVQPEKN